MTKISLSVETLASLTGKSQEELLKLTKKEDGTTDATDSEISSAVKSLILAKYKTIGETESAKALKNGLEKREKELAKALGIDSYDDFADLTAKIVEKKGEGTAAPELQKQVEKYKAEAKAMQEAIVKAKAEKDAFIADVQNKTLKEKAIAKLIAKGESLGLNLPSDPTKKRKLLETLAAQELDGKKIKEDGDDFVFVDEAGDVVKDEAFAPKKATKSFETILLGTFDLAPKGGGNPPPPNPATGGNYNFATDLLKNGTEFMKKHQELQKAGDKAQADALSKAYDQANGLIE
jgi:hypothetical protein